MPRLVLLAGGIAMMAGPASTQTLAGDWIGTAQFVAVAAGQEIQDAHAVTRLTLRIEAGGKVSGASREAGCQILGLSSAVSSNSSALTMDVTLKHCRHSSLNGRYSGTVALNGETASLLLRAGKNTLWGSEVKATLRR